MSVLFMNLCSDIECFFNEAFSGIRNTKGQRRIGRKSWERFNYSNIVFCISIVEIINSYNIDPLRNNFPTAVSDLI
jgi:hypothetical protein